MESTLIFTVKLCASTNIQLSKACLNVALLVVSLLQAPTCHDEWLQIAQGFQELWQFPHCIGALDGKHVVITPPPGSGAAYRNYKGTFSIVLMALVDADLNFIFADVGKNGRLNDSGVWTEAKLRLRIESDPTCLPPPEQLPNSCTSAPYVIVGDEGFGLKPYLMRPYPVAELQHEKRIFNYRCGLRKIVHNIHSCICFGHLSLFFEGVQLFSKVVSQQRYLPGVGIVWISGRG